MSAEHEDIISRLGRENAQLREELKKLLDPSAPKTWNALIDELATLRTQVTTLTEQLQAEQMRRASADRSAQVAEVMREELTAQVEAIAAERDALKSLLKLPGDICLSCGGTGGHEEGCMGTTALVAVTHERDQLAREAGCRTRPAC